MVKNRKYFGFHKRRSDHFGTRQDLAANGYRVFLPNNVAELCSCYVLFAVSVGKQAKPAAEPVVAKQNEARRPVSRVLSPLARVMAIHLGRPLPDASRDLPGRRRGNPPADVSPRAAPIWSCSRWGLPCHCRYRQRGALLPHPFTLARLRPSGASAGGLLSVALSLGSPPPGVTRHRVSVEPGLSSPGAGRNPAPTAAIRPSGTFNT